MKPLDDDFNYDIPPSEPKAAKGGVYAPADVKLIKDALVFYAKHNANISDAEERQAVNLLHRLNNRI
jgi:hypothetical protein